MTAPLPKHHVLHLYISEPEPRSAGPILVCDADHNDIAEFWHNEQATVAQTYETALALAQKLVDDSIRAAMKDALDGLVLVCGRTGNSLEDFEECAEAFRKETGWHRPGKDVSAASGDTTSHEDRREKYSAWVESKIEAARTALAKAS